MAIEKNTLMHDILEYIKKDLLDNIDDPNSSKRNPKSKLVMTSYPKRPVEYPLITVKIVNVERARAGMQTTNEDILITLELRIWARDEPEKDKLYDDVINRLNSVQFTLSTGSVANGLHDYNSASAIEIDEEGDGNQVIKSRVIQLSYKFHG